MLGCIAAISVGASLGALMRWGLGLLLNQIFPLIPLGTLAANLIGGFCIGLSLSVFADNPHLSVESRLFVITGFLGALTTFSTFSAEVAYLVQQQRLFMAMSAVALHVVGSLVMTFMGMWVFQAFRKIAG